MSIATLVQNAALTALNNLYQQPFTLKDFQVNTTKPEFEGDQTIVLFFLVKSLKKSPDQIGKELGDKLVEDNPELFTKYNIIKGFLNLSISDAFLQHIISKNYTDKNFGKVASNGKRVMVEYSSPNTNKPLHLGHLRNIFIGWSVAEILKAVGNDVIKTCIVNDRGIHICKSMIAWERFGNNETPQSTHSKGDHFVGNYYVKFNDAYKKEVEELITNGMTREVAEKEAPIMKSTQQMLQDWEAGKPEVMDLWKKMNGWVYEGFDITYKRIGADFNKVYYESDTYILGKEFVQYGLEKELLHKKDDGSVWIDLTAEGMDEKLLLRKDGTSVYMTQDIGLANQKFEEYKPNKSIYVIGDEQNYHMKVLQVVCKKLGMPFADDIYHLSYGMVELPSGKMKSREGTVVDADDMVDEMISTAGHHTEELGKVKDFTADELSRLYETLGLGAMKFYLLRVDPKKRMVFNPEESIDFHGYTGPFIQYTYARIQSIIRKDAGKATVGDENVFPSPGDLFPLERAVILKLDEFEIVLLQAGEELNPSVLAHYIFELAQTFNSFYTEHSIVNAESAEKHDLRLHMAVMTGNVIKSGMQLLGIGVPERM